MVRTLDTVVARMKEHMLQKSLSKGMQPLYGFIKAGYRFQVCVPTTIFEANAANVRVYNMNDEKHKKPLDETYIPLHAMPYWDPLHQIIDVQAKDKKTLYKKVDSFVKKYVKNN